MLYSYLLLYICIYRGEVVSKGSGSGLGGMADDEDQGGSGGIGGGSGQGKMYHLDVVPDKGGVEASRLLFMAQAVDGSGGGATTSSLLLNKRATAIPGRDVYMRLVHK